MSGAGNYASVVSRQELGALLASAREEHAAAARRPIGIGDAVHGEAARVAARFAAEQGRGLSTLHQTPIRFRFSHCEEISLRQFAGAMLATDRVARIDLGVGAEDAYLLLSRPLVFGWMMLAFGSRPEKGPDLIPSRAYTRIEERFLLGAAEDAASTFVKVLTGESDARERVIAVEDPVTLHDRSKRAHRVITVDVEGLGEPSCLRIALPLNLMDENATDHSATPAAPSPELAEQLLEMPVELHVEIGSVELPLSELARLSLGDELALGRAGEKDLLVNVEGIPKFRAEPGKLGSRLAVRITETIQP